MDNIGIIRVEIAQFRELKFSACIYKTELIRLEDTRKDTEIRNSHKLFFEDKISMRKNINTD